MCCYVAHCSLIKMHFAYLKFYFFAHTYINLGKKEMDAISPLTITSFLAFQRREN